MNVASWPHWYEVNPYLRAFYAGLETHGVTHLPHVPLDLGRLREAGADALHIHWAYPVWRDPRGVRDRAAALIGFHRLLRGARREGIRILWTVHNLAHHEGSDGWDRIGERPLWNADLRIYTSEWARGAAEGDPARGLPPTGSTGGHGGWRTRPGEAVVVPIGDLDAWLSPDPGRESARAAHGIPPGTRLLLCFGQIRPYKGFDVAVRALRRLAPRYRLVVAGHPVSPDHRIALPPPPAADRLTLVERRLAETELVGWLSAADAVLLPYRRITGSAALLTALSRARGVVATDLPYFREVLRPEPEAGVLVAPDDPESLASGIERFFQRPPEVRGAAARRLARGLVWDDLVAPVAGFLERSAGAGRSG